MRKIRALLPVERPPGWRESNARRQTGKRPVGTDTKRRARTDSKCYDNRHEKEVDTARDWGRLFLLRNVRLLIIHRGRTGGFGIADQGVEPGGGKCPIHCGEMGAMVFVVNGSVARINPELDERMPVRGFRSSSKIGRKEKEPEKRQAPEEVGPDLQSQLAP